MNVRDVFRVDLGKEIKEVIKVDDADAHDVIDEIGQYVITEHIHDSFRDVLEQYVATIKEPSEDVNIWVSGFFGSGKSSFAKVLGYVLADSSLGDVTPTELFEKKLSTTELPALLATIHEQAPTHTVFVDLASARNVAREGESVVLPLYRELLTTLEYSREPRLAELEFTLEEDGRLDEFEEAFERVNGHPWRKRRDKALAIIEASQALHEIGIAEEPDEYAESKPEVEITANWFVKRATELTDRRLGPGKRVLLVLDEAGQYVSRSVHRMLDLQGLAQAIQKEDGRVWLVATGQETLEDVVGALGDKRVELARVNDRFAPGLRVDLMPSDIEEVVSQRVLAKNADGEKALRALYEAHQHQLLSSTTLESPTRGEEFTAEDFVRTYPLIPYQIQLFIDAVSALRQAGGTGPTVGGASRTLIRIAHRLVSDIVADSEVGALVTTSHAYEIMSEMIPTAWQAEIKQVADRHKPNELHQPIARTVALLSGVRALQRDIHNLAVLLHPAVDAETLKSDIETAVKDLVAEEVLRKTDDGYSLQSPEEKDWEKDRRSRELRSADFNRLLRDTHLPALLRGLSARASRDFPITVFFDDNRILEGDLSLRIYEGGEDQFERAIRRSRESAHDNDVFLVFERDDETWRIAEEVFRSDEIIRDRESRSTDGRELDLLHEERRRLEHEGRRFERALERDLLSGSLVFRGTQSNLDGNELRTALAEALATHVAAIYTRLDDFTAPVSRRDATSLVKADDLDGLPDYLGTDGLGVVKLTGQGPQIDEDGVVHDLVAEVKRRVEHGSEPTGKSLEVHFHSDPFGAELDIVMIIASAAVRAGLVKVGYRGSWLPSHGDARLEQVFSRVPDFRGATFQPKQEPDPELRARVARLLHEDLVGERPGLASEDLARFARQRLAPDRHRANEAVLALSSMDMTAPDSVMRSVEVLDRMGEEDDETLVQSLDAARNDLRDGIPAARDLRELIGDEERVTILRRAAELERQLPNEDETDEAKVLREILDGRTFLERFADLRVTVEAIEAERGAKWDEAKEQLDIGLDEVRKQAAPLLAKASEAQSEEFDRVLSQMAEVGASADSGLSADSILGRVARLPAVLEGLQRSAAESGGADLETVRARELFHDPVTNEEDLDRLLAAIRAAGEAALADGKHFYLA